jgi:hypothetical protein
MNDYDVSVSGKCHTNRFVRWPEEAARGDGRLDSRRSVNHADTLVTGLNDQDIPQLEVRCSRSTSVNKKGERQNYKAESAEPYR